MKDSSMNNNWVDAGEFNNKLHDRCEAFPRNYDQLTLTYTMTR